MSTKHPTNFTPAPSAFEGQHTEIDDLLERSNDSDLPMSGQPFWTNAQLHSMNEAFLSALRKSPEGKARMAKP